MDTQRNYRVTPHEAQTIPTRAIPQMYENGEQEPQTREVQRRTLPRSNGTQLSLQEQIQKQQERMQERNSRYFKRVSGRNQIRVMPSWRGPTEPWWIEVPTHENIGPDKKFETCQAFFHAECLFCDLMNKLAQSHDASDLNVANALNVKYGLYANVARNEEDAIVKPWRMPQIIFYYIQACYGDPFYEGRNPLDPKTGYDLVFTYNPLGKGPANMYPRIELARNPSPIVVRGGRKGLPNLDAFWKPRSRQEQRAIINGGG